MRLYDDVQAYQWSLQLADSIIDAHELTVRGYVLALRHERKSQEKNKEEIDFLKGLNEDLINTNTNQRVEILGLEAKKKKKNLLIAGGAVAGFILGILVVK